MPLDNLCQKMTFQEKLKKLGPTINKSQRARAVGLKENAISTYMATESLPRIDIALKIARALDVPLEWLADDEADWPARKANHGVVENIPDGFLMREVCRRLRLAMLDVKEQIEKAERIDWQAVANRLLNQPAETPFPPDIAPEIELAGSLMFASSGLYKFEASDAIKAHWRDLPPINIPEEDLDFGNLLRRLRDLNQRPGCAATQVYQFVLTSEDGHPDPTTIIDAREKLRADLTKVERPTAGKESSGKSASKSPRKK